MFLVVNDFVPSQVKFSPKFAGRADCVLFIAKISSFVFCYSKMFPFKQNKAL